jgi:F0F1-type ATP synthase delta subunit
MSNSPRLKLASVIADRTLNKGISKDLARQVAAYLIDDGLVYELDSMLRDVQQDWAKNGLVEVTASAAHPIDETIRAQIIAEVKVLYPDAEKITVSEKIDPEILSGVKLNMVSQQLDLSAEAKLNRFKQLT